MSHKYKVFKHNFNNNLINKIKIDSSSYNNHDNIKIKIYTRYNNYLIIKNKCKIINLCISKMQ